MQLPFVCASCRRRLLRQATQAKLLPDALPAKTRASQSNTSRNVHGGVRHKDTPGRKWHRKSPAEDDRRIDQMNQDFVARLLGPSQDINARRIYSRHFRDDRVTETQGESMLEPRSTDDRPPEQPSSKAPSGKRLILSHTGPLSWGALRRSMRAEEVQSEGTQSLQGAARDSAQVGSRIKRSVPAQHETSPNQPSKYRSNSQLIRAWSEERDVTSINGGNDARISTLDLPFRHQRHSHSKEAAEPLKSPTLFPSNPLSQLLGLDVSTFTEEIPLYKMEDEAGLQTACAAFLKKMVPAWASGKLEQMNFPAPNLVLAKTRVKPLSTKFFQYWEQTTWALLQEICRRQEAPEASHSGPSQDDLLVEVIRLWRMLLIQYADKSVTPERKAKQAEPLSWAHLSESEKMGQVRRWFSKDFTARWNHFFRQTGYAGFHGTDSAALLTLVLFRKAGASSKAITKQGLQLQDFIARLIVNSSLSSDLEKHLAVISEHLEQQLDDIASLKDSLDGICANTVTILGEYEAALKSMSSNHTQRTNPDTDLDPVVESFKKRIGRALADGNPHRLDVLFQESRNSALGDTTSPSRLHPYLYHHFIYAFTALKRPHRASEVWASMVDDGVHAGLPAWDALIRGCGMARDRKSINEVWNRMIESGIQPDSHVWATRIHALVTSGHWQSAMAAFQEMISQWIQAARAAGAKGNIWELPDVEGAPKPTARCLNSLLSGLAKGYKFDQVGEVLEWAKSIDIKLDAYTFNPLLKVAALRKDGHLTDTLLRQMEAMKIEPDIATFTMMLDSIFQADDTAQPVQPTIPSSSQQPDGPVKSKSEAVAGVFRAMQMAGVKATAHTFATLISGLLKSRSPNPDAAYSILTHLKSHDLPLTGAVYTPLITHHFDQSPPDFDAVESLWHEARAIPSMRIDVVFYDRLIEGFAKADQIGNALTALGQAGKRGKVPGWIAMHEIVSALVRAGDYERAANLVATVRGEERSKDKVRENRGRANFWATVEQAGLGDHEDAQSP